MVDTFNYADYYGADPWGDITQNERPWYDPVLREMYMRQSVYSQFATMKVDLNGPRARTIYFNDLIPPRPNIGAISARKMEATRLYTDSFQKSVTTERFGNGMALHRESEMFSYWQRFGGGTGFGLLPIIQQSIGHVLVDHLDLLARNAYFANPYPMFGNGSATGFSGLSTSTDKATTDLLDAVWLGHRDRTIPFSPVAQGYVTGNEVLCVTTAGFVHDLKREVGTGTGGLNFVDVHKYNNAGAALLHAGELGMYRGIRFIDNPMAKLWNVGEIDHQTAIKSAVQPGDGAPDPSTTLVEGVRRVGQPAAKHYIEVADASGFTAGDKVTIHVLRATSDDVATGRAVTDGVLYTDPMAQDVEIHSVDTTTTPDRIVLKEPYMMTQDNGKGLETDLGSSVFGYVTKAQTVHTALFLQPGRLNGIIAGVAQSPIFYTPPPNDDYMSMYRINEASPIAA